MGGGFHCTTFECVARIFREGLRPGGGGDRINTFFVPFAPWDERSQTVLRFRKIEGADLVYIYLTYESIAKFAPRVSADGHILVQQTIPFSAFDAVWHYDHKSGEYYRLMVTKGYEQLVLSVKGATKIATIDRFDNLIANVVPDESSPDLSELRKLIDIKTAHESFACRLYPTHHDWYDAIALLALTHRPNKEGHRLCPACLCETPATLSICVFCKGYLVSHGFRRRVKITVASVPTAERRSHEDDVKDHVKQTWEKIKVDLTNDDEEEVEIEQDDDDVEMESPPEETQKGNDDDMGQKPEADELKSERRNFREQDEVDKFLKEEREKAEKIEEERADHANISIGEYRAGDARNANITYPAWMKRVQFGSKVLPAEPCQIGDAQPDLIKILLLQIGSNIHRIYRHFQRNFCGEIGNGWQQFQNNPYYRIDLDPKVPYLGEDEDGNLIEPTDEQMADLYDQIGDPNSKNDLGKDGFTNAYHGSLIFKKLITYLLECGYEFTDMQKIFGDDNIQHLAKGDTAEEEARKSNIARDSLDAQSTFVRRVIGGAYQVTAVYFFRNVDFQAAVTLNPVDILCACRPQLRRIAVMHLILQNDQRLPRPLMNKLRSAIDDHNRCKKRDGQRPKWGAHMTDSHVAAITNMSTTEDAQGETEAPKAKAMPKPSATPDARPSQSSSSTDTRSATPMPKQNPKTPPWREGESHGSSRNAPSHRGGDWNYTGYSYGKRGWR